MTGPFYRGLWTFHILAGLLLLSHFFHAPVLAASVQRGSGCAVVWGRSSKHLRFRHPHCPTIPRVHIVSGRVPCENVLLAPRCLIFT